MTDLNGRFWNATRILPLKTDGMANDEMSHLFSGSIGSMGSVIAQQQV
jgi:hypothetical protein